MTAIRSVAIYHGQVACDLWFSYGRVDTMAMTIVVVAAGPHTGFGEGGNTEHLRPLSEGILGKDAGRCDALLPPLEKVGAAPCSSREALSIALWDLNAKLDGVPLYLLLGGRRRYPVPLMPCVFGDPPEETAAKARDLVGRLGFRAMKMKFVGEPSRDLAALGAVRHALGDDVLIHADANCGYKDLGTALEVLKECAKLGLHSIEDPLDQSLDVSALLGATRVKIAGDVSTRTTPDALRAIEAGSLDILWQHPGCQGGIDEFVQRREAAIGHGMPVWIGGTGFTGVGTAAYQHLGCAFDDGFPVGEVGGWIDHGQDRKSVKDPLPIREGAVWLDDSKPGLGVELDYAVLEDVCEKTAIA